MFSFITDTKPRLSELIYPDSVDIHSHLLPGIDDEDLNITNATYLLRGLRDLGFSNIITTPIIASVDWNAKSNLIKETLRKNKSILTNQTINHFKVAAEYIIDSSLQKLLETQELMTLKDNYILVSMPITGKPADLYDIIYKIQVAGYEPILAHPECYLYLQDDFKNFKKLKLKGCLFQLNILSTVGYYGKKILKTADWLLAEGYIDYVGTDLKDAKQLEAFQSKMRIQSIQQFEKALERNKFFIR